MKYVLLAFLIAGCGGSSSTGREPDQYTGCGSDENWRTFADFEAMADASNPPVFTGPAAGSSQSLSTLRVTWQPDAGDVGAVQGNVANDPTSCPEYNTGGIMPLHLPPISGDVYDLQFTVDGTVAWRVITTLQEWGPPPGMTSLPPNKNVSLKIWRMSVLRNDLKMGPYVSAPLAFATTP